MMKAKEEDIRARCSAEMHAELKAIARDRDEAVSTVVREAIRRYLAEVKLARGQQAAGAVAGASESALMARKRRAGSST